MMLSRFDVYHMSPYSMNICISCQKYIFPALLIVACLLLFQKIYDAKGRPGDNPLIVHVPSLSSITTYVSSIPPVCLALANAFWPGPLALVLQRASSNSGISTKVSCGMETLAFRVPEHPVALEFLKLAGLPIAAPSANISGTNTFFIFYGHGLFRSLDCFHRRA